MRPLGVVKTKFRKVVKLSFTGSVTNEVGGSGTSIFLGANVNITGNKLNLNGGSGSNFSLSQVSGNDWFNLQRDFDLTFDLVISNSDVIGEILAIEDGTQSSFFRLDYQGAGVLRILHAGTPNTTSATSTAVNIGVSLPIKIEYRRTSVKLFVNNVVRINATGWLQRTNVTRSLWVGGYGATNAILGSLDNVEMTLIL